MKIMLGCFAVIAAFVGASIYDNSGNRDCHIRYDRSFDGLWIIKERQCLTRIGLAKDPVELARKPLFEAF